MNKYKRLLSNTAILGAGTFASKVLVFLLMPLYTAILSAEAFGTADLIAQTANLLIPLASVGICDGLFRFTLEAEANDRKKVFTVSVTVLALGSLALALIAGAIYLLDGPNIEYLPLIVLYVVCANFHSVCAHYLRAKGRTTLFAVQGLVNTALTIGLNILLLIVFQLGSTGYVLSVVIADLLLALGLFFGCGLWKDFGLKFFDRAMLRDVLKFSIPYIPTTMLWLVTSVSDRYFVTIFCGTEVHGLYTAASKLPTLIVLVSGVFIEAWHFSTVKDALPAERASFFGTVYRNYMSVMFIGASLIIACSRILTGILLADSYYSSWQYVPYLAVAMIFSAFSSFFGSVYFMEKKSVLSMLTALAGAIVNVGLNFLLIPKWGALGAALATMLSYMVTYAIRAYNTAQYLKFDQHHVRVTVNTVLLVLQAYLMIAAIPYWQFAQLAIVILVLIFNGKGLAVTLFEIFGKKNSKKSKKN